MTSRLWTEEDVEHLDEAIYTIKKETGAIALPGLEYVREKVARLVKDNKAAEGLPRPTTEESHEHE